MTEQTRRATLVLVGTLATSGCLSSVPNSSSTTTPDEYRLTGRRKPSPPEDAVVIERTHPDITDTEPVQLVIDGAIADGVHSTKLSETTYNSLTQSFVSIYEDQEQSTYAPGDAVYVKIDGGTVELALEAGMAA